MVNIVVPIVICVVILVCFIVGFVLWRFYRERCCCCCGTTKSSRDPEEPNTRTEVKRVDPNGKDDLKRAAASNVKTTTPDIIINFVPSRHKNINSEQASRTRKGKETDLTPLENSR